MAWPGYVADKVDLTEKVSAAGINDIRDRALQVFASTALRTAGLVTPLQGQVSVINTGSRRGPYMWNGASWERPFNLPWGRLDSDSVSVNQTGIAAETDITSLSVTAVIEAGRITRTTLQIPEVQQATSAGVATIAIADAANAHLRTAVVSQSSGWTFAVHISVDETLAAGTVVRHARAGTSANTLNMLCSAAGAQMTMTMEDMGPA